MALILKNKTSLHIGTMSERAAVEHGGTTITLDHDLDILPHVGRVLTVAQFAAHTGDIADRLWTAGVRARRDLQDHQLRHLPALVRGGARRRRPGDALAAPGPRHRRRAADPVAGSDAAHRRARAGRDPGRCPAGGAHRQGRHGDRRPRRGHHPRRPRRLTVVGACGAGRRPARPDDAHLRCHGRSPSGPAHWTSWTTSVCSTRCGRSPW